MKVCEVCKKEVPHVVIVVERPGGPEVKMCRPCFNNPARYKGPK